VESVLKTNHNFVRGVEEPNEAPANVTFRVTVLAPALMVG
jgi:hypothetical protein